jgi:hypothetical protein
LQLREGESMCAALVEDRAHHLAAQKDGYR